MRIAAFRYIDDSQCVMSQACRPEAEKGSSGSGSTGPNP